MSNCLAAMGASAILLSFAFLDEETRVPGFGTLLPVVGTGLLILAGTSHASIINKVLEARPIAYLGDMSYSLYLWHWPFYVFWVQFGLTRSPQNLNLLLLLGLTVFVSWLSYRLIEEKFRAGNPDQTESGFWKVFAIACLPLVVTGAWLITGQNSTLSIIKGMKAGDIGHDDYHQYVEETFAPCLPSQLWESALKWESFTRCQQSHADLPPTIALVGDSHAEHLFIGVANSLPDENVVYLIDMALPTADSSDRMEQILDYVEKSQSIRTVVIAAFWEYHGVPVEDLQNTVHRFQTTGKQVLLTNDIPVADQNPEVCKFPRTIFAKQDDSDCRSGSSDSNRPLVLQSLSQIASNSGAVVLDTYGLFCQSGKCSIDSQDHQKVLYRDEHHLNILGSKFVGATVASSLLD